ncbi:hypothetical protein GCM10027037_05750 [Mucilaginibacter koreensis]
MSVQKALIFISQYRENDKLSVQLISLSDVLIHAFSNGYEFSLIDLEKAFMIDWKMRWVKYKANAKTTDADRSKID